MPSPLVVAEFTVDEHRLLGVLERPARSTSSVTTPFGPVTASCERDRAHLVGRVERRRRPGERARPAGHVGSRRLRPHDRVVGRARRQPDRGEFDRWPRRRRRGRRRRWPPRSTASSWSSPERSSRWSSWSIEVDVVDVVEVGRASRRHRRPRLARNTPMPASNTTTAAMLAPMVMPRRLDSFMAPADVRAGSRAM